MLVGISISLIMVGAFAAVGVVSAAQPKVYWKTNPVTITLTGTSGSGSKTDSFTCRPAIAGLTLIGSSGTPKVHLTVTPSTVASCGSTQQSVALTATCLVAAQQCAGSYHGQIQVRQPALYRTLSETLRVTIHVTDCVNGNGECEQI